MRILTINIFLNSTKIVINRSSEWDRRWKWIWLIAFIGGLLFQARHADEIREAYLSLKVIHRPIAALLVCFAILPYISKQPFILFRGIIGLLTIFGLWRLMSTFWSIEPLWTFYRSLEFLIMVALTAITTWSLRSITDLQKWMNWFWLWHGFLLVSIWIGVVVFPEKALLPSRGVIPYLLAGVIPVINPNNVATIGAILSVVSFTRWLTTGKRKWLLLMMPAFTTMILAQGRSAMAGALLGILLTLILSRRYNLITFLSLLISILVIVPTFRETIKSYFMRGQTEELFWSFTGRQFWWQYALNYIKENPWIGYGAFAFSRFKAAEDLNIPTFSGLHNSWVDVAVEIGIPGAILLAVIFVAIWFSCIKVSLTGNLEERRLAIELSGVLAILTIRSFFTSALIFHNAWPFFLIIGGISWLTISYKGKSKFTLP